MTPKKDAKKKKPGKGANKKKAPADKLLESTHTALEFPPAAYRVMWDWERDKFEKIKRPNLPGVFRCGELSNHLNGHYVNLTRDWQFFWFDLCCQIYYGRYHQDLTPDEYKWLADKWTGVGATTTAFTNQHGLDDFRNYVLDTNADKEEPMIYTLVCGGATLTGTPVAFKKGGKNVWMLKVTRFDGTKPPPPVETIDPYMDPRVFFATTITNKRVKKKYQIPVFDVKINPPGYRVRELREGYKVNPFPQFKKDGLALDCPVPLIASQDIYYPLKDLVPLETADKPSPYFP